MGTVVLIGSALVGAASAVQSAQSQKKAAGAAQEQAQAQRESLAAQGRSATVETQRQRIAQIREARIRRAQVLASAGAEGMGLGGTSGVTGAVGSISSQMASNIGTINQQETFAQQATQANMAAADAASRVALYQAKGAQWQSIGGMAGTIFDRAGGWTSIFGGNTPKT